MACAAVIYDESIVIAISERLDSITLDALSLDPAFGSVTFTIFRDATPADGPVRGTMFPALTDVGSDLLAGAGVVGPLGAGSYSLEWVGSYLVSVQKGRSLARYRDVPTWIDGVSH